VLACIPVAYPVVIERSSRIDLPVEGQHMEQT